MQSNQQWRQIEAVCQELGLPADMVSRLRDRLLVSLALEPLAVEPIEMTTAREREIMQLIGTKTPDRLVHDVRNLLNEVALLRAVADLGSD